MTWLQRHRIRHYVANSIWVYPLLSMAAAIVAVRLLHWVEQDHAWGSPVDAATATAVLGTLAASLFTAAIFVCSSLLVAVQLASAALTPRIIGLVFRDPVTKFSLTALVFTFTFTLSALIRIEQRVPLLTTYTAAYASLLSLGVFFYLIDHLGKTLRPSGALRAVARRARVVIGSVYPCRLGEAPGTRHEADALPAGGAPAEIPSDRDGVVLAFDQQGLTELARRADCVIELVPQVGDHLAAGDPLFRLYQCAAAPPSTAALHQAIAVGQERTVEQDPTFPFRMLVDIASKALSPGINDPTTAVLALDQIHHLLRIVGSRHLDTGTIHDAAGRLRLVYRTLGWEDFVHLAVTEIRQFGGESIQVARRMHAMLENLIQTLPETRAALLRQELALLNRSAERSFAEPEDRALAAVNDLQGVGGKPEISRRAIDGEP